MGRTLVVLAHVQDYPVKPIRMIILFVPARERQR